MNCPKCKSKNIIMKIDNSDKFNDLCLICQNCGYSEIEQKRFINKLGGSTAMSVAK